MFVKIKLKRWNGTAFVSCKKNIAGAGQLNGSAHNRILKRSYLSGDMRIKSLVVNLKEIKA